MMAHGKIDIGHNYPSVFLRTVQNLPANRLALWAYHNQDNIGFEFWKQVAHRGGVEAEIDRLRKSGLAVDQNYVDAEFEDDPDLMYSEEFVSAIYQSSGFEYSSDWTMPWTT